MTSPKQNPEAVMSRAMQIELVTAVERGDERVLVHDWLVRYPAMSDDIVACAVALRAIDRPEMPLAAPVEAAVTRGMQAGLARIGLAAPAVVTLDKAIKAAGTTKVALARRLHLGIGVVEKLVRGSITLTSIPQRLFDQLGQALDTNREQARQWVEASFTMGMQVSPALRREQRPSRGKKGDTAPVAPRQESFTDAIQHDLGMDEDAKAAWLKRES